VIQSPTSLEPKIGVPHHHHVPRHHHHHHHVAAHPKPVHVPVPKPKQIVRSQAVLDSVANLPRVHLGHAIYESKIKAGEQPSRDGVTSSHQGFVTSMAALPRLEGHENKTFTVRVPRVHLTPVAREEITAHRNVWGTDVYTDDSDVIAACIHNGWFRGEWPEDIDKSLLGLEIDVPEEPSSNGAHRGKAKVVRKERIVSKLGDINLFEPPASGPMEVPENQDLHVTLLILPQLEKYSSTTRFGIRSREWPDNHDGVSYMIHSIKWVAGTDTAKEATGKARRMRMAVNLRQDEKEEEERLALMFSTAHVNGADAMEIDSPMGVQESFERGEPGPLTMGIKGLGMGGWWKEKARKMKQKPMVENSEPVAAPTPAVEAAESESVKQEEKSDEPSQASGMIVS
jgi:hypothetical protein